MSRAHSSTSAGLRATIRARLLRRIAGGSPLGMALPRLRSVLLASKRVSSRSASAEVSS